MRHQIVAERLASLIETGVIATCATLDADFDIAREVLEFDSIWVAPRGSLP